MSDAKFINKYKLIGLLGSGNYGQVYHVYDLALNADKAIKILNTIDPNNFLASFKEAQILNKCRHKHIVTINEANIFNVDGKPRVILDLEHISNGSLEKTLQNRWLSIKESIIYMRGTLLGLQHAHSQGFLHRDIKPGNILLDKDTAKLSDFGLATNPGAGLIGSGQGYKTHLAPEYFKTSETSKQTDIFAAGITFFRLVSNIKNWHDTVKIIPNVQHLIQHGKLIEKIGFESFIPSSIQRIIRKACNPDPQKRFQSAQEFCQQLDRIRFDVDWTRVSAFEWHGRHNNYKYICKVNISKSHLLVLKNNRQIHSECRELNNLSSTIAAMNDYVARTTIKKLV